MALDTLHINGTPAPGAGRRLPSGRFLIERDLAPGEVLSLSTSANPDFTVAAVPHNDTQINPFGLNQRFLTRRLHYDKEVAAFTLAYKNTKENMEKKSASRFT